MVEFRLTKRAGDIDKGVVKSQDEGGVKNQDEGGVKNQDEEGVKSLDTQDIQELAMKFADRIGKGGEDFVPLRRQTSMMYTKNEDMFDLLDGVSAGVGMEDLQWFTVSE
ncbi:mitochondrial chaperone BCS1 [Cordyceps militaris]|uniref:Mitochondrial chaperone BCS1 n=1 Tax=Cordyceps militaris TaxID=73501 RepID=A0A2H4S7H6_CORMI|nr:mitochondrial chaperone BCS1 [Cordyceps militaris]